MKVRIGIFETNSSSTHSISFNPWTPGKDGNNFSIQPSDGKIHIGGGEFGWEWESYNDAVTKASYYYEQYKDDPDRMRILKEVIEGYTGYPVEIDPDTSGYCRIDHQSRGTLDLPKDDEDAVKDWIFNPDVWLYTGNDNGDEPPYLHNDEFDNLTGDRVTITLQFLGNTFRVKIVGLPNYDNLRNALEEFEPGDGNFYSLESLDLENNSITLLSSWNNVRTTGKILKIESDELGTFLL